MLIPSILPPTSAATGASFIQSSGKTGMGNAVIVNQCPYPLYIWLVDQNEFPPAPITIPSKGKHVEPFRTPCVESGVSLKVSKTPSPSSIVHFEYALNKSGLLYHDISLTKCASGNDASACPSHVHGLKVEGRGMQGCQTLECAANAYCPADACYVPIPGAYQPVKTCSQN